MAVLSPTIGKKFLIFTEQCAREAASIPVAGPLPLADNRWPE